MAAPPPLTFAIPTALEVQNARPVMGNTLMPMASALEHFAGVRARGWHPCAAWSEPDTAATDIGDLLSPSSRTEVIRVLCRTSPLTTHLAVAMEIASLEVGGSLAPTVVAAVYDLSGVAVDIGCTWTRARRTLSGATEPRVLVVGVAAVDPVRPQLVETPPMMMDETANDVSPSEPRLLFIDTYGGDDLEVRVTTQACWTVSVTVFEYVEATS